VRSSPPSPRSNPDKGSSQTYSAVDSLTSRLEAQTIQDDDEDLAHPIPIRRPEISSNDPIFKVVEPKNQRRFFRKGKVCYSASSDC
jgi:hypothetical protein